MQADFNSYEMLRIDETPAVEFSAATGMRVRKLPIRADELV